MQERQSTQEKQNANSRYTSGPTLRPQAVTAICRPCCPEERVRVNRGLGHHAEAGDPSSPPEGPQLNLRLAPPRVACC